MPSALRCCSTPTPEVLEAYLFGSYARGRQQPHSDIDVAVRVDEARTDNRSFGYRAHLTTDLMAGLGCNDVDVLILNRAPPVLYHRVVRDGVRVLSRDLAATTTREGQALSRYCDFVPPAREDGGRPAPGGEASPNVSPGRADMPVVRRHLAALRSALPILHRHAGVSPQALNADPERRWSVERGLQICAQNTLDVATHLASTLGLDTSDYASAIDRLVESEVLPAEFGARFRAVAGFRNILVHGYLDVDLEIVADAVNRHLGDFEEFARHVERWIET